EGLHRAEGDRAVGSWRGVRAGPGPRAPRFRLEIVVRPLARSRLPRSADLHAGRARRCQHTCADVRFVSHSGHALDDTPENAIPDIRVGEPLAGREVEPTLHRVAKDRLAVRGQW